MLYYIKRSAKGTQWADHKYKDIVNGRYIYDEEADRKAHGGKSSFDDIRAANEGKDWHDVIYDHVDKMIRENPKLNTGMIANAPIEDFANTLKALTSLNVDEMTVGQLETMRAEIVKHYAPKNELLNTTKTKSSDKPKDEPAEETKKEDKETYVPEVYKITSGQNNSSSNTVKSSTRSTSVGSNRPMARNKNITGNVSGAYKTTKSGQGRVGSGRRSGSIRRSVWYIADGDIVHYAKGQTAQKHKYIRKEGDRYIYDERDLGRYRAKDAQVSGNAPIKEKQKRTEKMRLRDPGVNENSGQHTNAGFNINKVNAVEAAKANYLKARAREYGASIAAANAKADRTDYYDRKPFTGGVREVDAAYNRSAEWGEKASREYEAETAKALQEYEKALVAFYKSDIGKVDINQFGASYLNEYNTYTKIIDDDLLDDEELLQEATDVYLKEKEKLDKIWNKYYRNNSQHYQPPTAQEPELMDEEEFNQLYNMPDYNEELTLVGAVNGQSSVSHRPRARKKNVTGDVSGAYKRRR